MAAVKKLAADPSDRFLLTCLRTHLQPVFRYWIERAVRLGCSSPSDAEMVREHGLESLERANSTRLARSPRTNVFSRRYSAACSFQHAFHSSWPLPVSPLSIISSSSLTLSSTTS